MKYLIGNKQKLSKNTISDTLAYNKPATQSGNMNGQPAYGAVDNDSTNTCAFSDNGPGGPPAWWQVDLQYDCYITSVSIQFPSTSGKNSFS